jgi:hypothetical protein
VVTQEYDDAGPALLAQLVRGDPGRFAWGPDGAKPHRLALARALLADVIGPDAAACDECGGTGQVVYLEAEGRDVPFNDPEVDPDTVDPIDVGVCVCEDGRRPLPVADFDTDYLVKLEAPWWLSRREILVWLARQFSQPPRWLADIMTEVTDPQGRI